MSSPRSPQQRKVDVLAHLTAPNADAWVASASADGEAHLVPLSCAWDGERLVLALETRSLTFRNVAASGHARLAFGATRDVVMVDAVVEATVDVQERSDGIAEVYAAQADWDPREAGPGFAYLVLRPRRIQAWREVDEIADRTLMRDGRWLV